MNGSKLKILAWILPVLAAAGFTARWLELRSARPTRSPVGPVATATTAPEPLAPPVAAVAAPDSAIAETADYQRLRSEILHLRQRIEQRERQLRTTRRIAVGTAMPAARPSLSDSFLEPELWQDAGTASPAALIETVLWAGAGGDVARMAALLECTPESLTAAESLWATLPPDVRPPGSDASALIALLATDSVPLAKAKLAGDFPQENGDRILLMQIDEGPIDGAPRKPQELRTVKLTARSNPADESWRIVVTPPAVDALAKRLEMPSASPSPQP